MYTVTVKHTSATRKARVFRFHSFDTAWFCYRHWCAKDLYLISIEPAR